MIASRRPITSGEATLLERGERAWKGGRSARDIVVRVSRKICSVPLLFGNILLLLLILLLLQLQFSVLLFLIIITAIIFIDISVTVYVHFMHQITRYFNSLLSGIHGMQWASSFQNGDEPKNR